MNKNFKSSQQSSNYIDFYTNEKVHSTSKSFIFQRDFLMEFSICFGRHPHNNKSFFKIKAEDKKLEKLLSFDEPNFLRYDFERLLMEVMRKLLLHGKCYVEKVKVFDEDDNLSGIYFKPFYYRRHLSFGGKLHYVIKNSDGKKIRGKVDNKNLIFFNLRDLGYSKLYFKRKLKKLDKLDSLELQSLTDSLKGDELLTLYKKIDYKTLKAMHKVHWGKITSNDINSSRAYKLYRQMAFDSVRNKFLKYLVDGYNTALKELGSECSFTGEIVYESKADGYEELMKDLRTGNKSCDEVSDIIYNLSKI